MPNLFIKLEVLFLQRFEQMTVDELTVCASGFSVSGFGSPQFTRVLEQGIMKKIGEFSTQSLKEVARGFVFSLRGSKQLCSMLLPRLRMIMSEFSLSEVCFMLYSYNEVGHLPKSFAQECEEIVKKKLMTEGQEITLKELALIVKVFCTSRTAHRNFHKLLETSVLMRVPELRHDLKTLHAIGF
jgi:hypothetical protein